MSIHLPFEWCEPSSLQKQLALMKPGRGHWWLFRLLINLCRLAIPVDNLIYQFQDLEWVDTLECYCRSIHNEPIYLEMIPSILGIAQFHSLYLFSAPNIRGLKPEDVPFSFLCYLIFLMSHIMMFLENTGGKPRGRNASYVRMLCELWLWQSDISYIFQVQNWFWLEMCTRLGFFHAVIMSCNNELSLL